jgi:hypothetical protein
MFSVPLIIVSSLIIAQEKYLRTEFDNKSTAFDIVIRTPSGSSTGRLLPAQAKAMLSLFAPKQDSMEATLIVQAYKPNATTLFNQSTILISLPRTVFDQMIASNETLFVGIHYDGHSYVSPDGTTSTPRYSVTSSKPMSFMYTVTPVWL